MIRLLQHEAIDKSAWDNCIENALNGNLYAYSWYLDVVSPAWCALVEDGYEKVFPLPVSSKAGIRYVMQPFFTQQLGLYSRQKLIAGSLNEYLDQAERNYRYIDINLNAFNQVSPGRNAVELTNLELDLCGDYGKISDGYKENLKRNLKKASGNKLTITKNVRPEEIISLFGKNKGADLPHLGRSQYSIIHRIAYQGIHKGIGETRGVYDEFNQLVAAALWINSHQKAVFLFSALSDSGKQLNAMPLLIDSFIRDHSGMPLTLDFEGSNDEGLARFYSSFGAKRISYQRYVYDSLPLPIGMAIQIWRQSRIVIKKILHLSE